VATQAHSANGDRGLRNHTLHADPRSASDQTIARIRTKKADASKVLYSTSRKFASQVAADKDSSEETYSDVSINADDAVASISFNFVFLSNGAPANLGKEAWLMVKTDAGWKIIGVAGPGRS